MKEYEHAVPVFEPFSLADLMESVNPTTKDFLIECVEHNLIEPPPSSETFTHRWIRNLHTTYSYFLTGKSMSDLAIEEKVSRQAIYKRIDWMIQHLLAVHNEGFPNKIEKYSTDTLVLSKNLPQTRLQNIYEKHGYNHPHLRHFAKNALHEGRKTGRYPSSITRHIYLTEQLTTTQEFDEITNLFSKVSIHFLRKNPENVLTKLNDIHEEITFPSMTTSLVVQTLLRNRIAVGIIEHPYPKENKVLRYYFIATTQKQKAAQVLALLRDQGRL